MGRRGENTRSCQRQFNLRNSRAKLEGLLAANFREGAQLVTLTYGPTGQIPSQKLAELQLQDWLRAARDAHGCRLRYIRATEREGGYPVHRVVLASSGAAVGPLAALWSHGQATAEPVREDGQSALAALLMAPALAAGRPLIPCGRIWSPSAGLIRPGKEKPV